MSQKYPIIELARGIESTNIFQRILLILNLEIIVYNYDRKI